MLADPDRIRCVGLLSDDIVGVVRFDKRVEQVFEVSINLNPAFRGKGYAPRVLEQTIKYLVEIRKISKLFAGFKKKINIHSRKTFEQAGFLVMHPTQYYPNLEQFDWEFE